MKITPLLAAIRVGEIFQDTQMVTVEELTEALALVRAHLAAGDIQLDAFIEEHAKGGPYQEVIDAVNAEGARPFRWQDGNRPMFCGDFVVTYGYPAFVYGIAMGLSIALDAEEGGAQ